MKEEILNFIWVCKKSLYEFEQKKMLRHQNKKIFIAQKLNVTK
jgi:hypothetical protein